MSTTERIAAAVVEGKKDEVATLSQQALDEGLSPKQILDRGLVAGMDVVGARFRTGEVFVPQVLVSARAMQAGLAVLRPHLTASGVKAAGTAVLGTVSGDLHDIGKNIVGAMLEGAGFTVIDLGSNVPAEKFVAAAREHDADIVGLSALLTTTMLQMSRVVNLLKEAGLRDRVKVIVGGAPVTGEFAREIGADAYGSNATAAVQLARGLLNPTEVQPK